jgi:hypothetical protein
MPRELTLSASQFKAQCLDLMAAGAANRLDRVNITKRGKAYVTLSFEDDRAPDPVVDPFGCMKGSTNLTVTDFAALETDLAELGEEMAALVDASVSRFS